MPTLTRKRETIDLSQVRPAGNCVLFGEEKPKDLGKTYSQKGVVFQALETGGLSIVELPAPKNWITPKVKYLRVLNKAALEVQFPSKASWVEASAAAVKGNGPVFGPGLFICALNEKGWYALHKWSTGDPFGLVRAYEFSKMDLVLPPKGEFVKTVPKPVEFGLITKLYISSLDALLLWKVCYA